MIAELIANISDQNILNFFQDKISSFKSEREDYEYLLPENQPFANLLKLGNAELNNADELIVFSCLYNGELTARSSKKRQFDIAKKVLGEAFSDGAIFIFYDASGNFRFSFIRKNYGNDEGKYSNWRRFTYYVQPDKENKTFRKRVGDCTYDSLEAIQKAFSVEPLSREFYKDLSHWYFASFNEVEFPNDRNENEYNLKANAMIRLITRLMFVWFMKQKGLVPDGLFDKEKVDGLLNYNDNTGSTYYKAILQNLFFATLNTPLGKDRKWVTTSGYGVQNFYRYQRFIKDEVQFFKWMNEIPFLNGGLFENLDIVQTEDKNNKLPKKDIRVDCFSDNKKNESRLKVPDYLFFGTRNADISGFFEDNKNTNVEIQGIIDILNRYDFTIDENTPDDQEVALDPELLGTVFENLLASYNPETQSTARKESGSFYTPRPIVDYMVRESLEYYLADSTGVHKDKLQEIGNTAQEITITTADKNKIIFALSEIKILDPACGSGAFPMGCLQHIVQMLNRLDPENNQWKAAQMAKLKEDLNNTIDQSDYKNLKENIDNIFSNRYNDADYARKLYLIQNCLYGVDIQPIAMQISKLRFFISLLVEQKIDRTKDNFGVIPLPNLETKFVAANTLLRLNKRVSTKRGSVGSGMFANLFVEEKEEELATVREKYFSARTPKTKRKWRAKDKTLRKEIADLLIDDGWDNDAALKIAHWDPFNQNAKADWFDPEWMFGVKNFDVVIGNPPYIKEYTNRDAFNGLRDTEYYQGKMDLWYYFACTGIDMLSKGGIECLIAQNNWITSAGASKLRNKVIEDTEIKNFIDFGNYKIFESAGIQTMVFVLKKCKPKKEYTIDYSLLKNDNLDRSSIGSFLKVEIGDTQDYFKENLAFIPNTFRDIPIRFVNSRYDYVLNKINDGNKYKLDSKEVANGIHPHYDFVNKKILEKSGGQFPIGQGIFGLSPDELEHLNLSRSEKNLIKPYYNSSQINRYITFKDNDEWLIYTDSSFKHKSAIKSYPKIKAHLDKFSNIITSDNHPYGLHRARNENFFKGEKIVVQRKCANNPVFSYSDFDCYVSATYYVIKPKHLNCKFLTVLLNSKLIEFWLLHMGKMQGNNYQLDKAPLVNIPIALPKDLSAFVNLFDKISSNILADTDSYDEQDEADRLVYKLYDLSNNDIDIIEGMFE